MSLDLEKHLTFYASYHSNHVNVAIHMVCVPLILASAFEMLSNFGPYFEFPSWLSIPYLDTNLGTLAACVYGALYVLLEPVAGSAMCILCLASCAGTNYLRTQNPLLTNVVGLGVFILSWILQFIGHGVYEGRAPALFDNLLQAFFLAPLFVWLEVLFGAGYRPELQARVEKAAAVEIAKFKASKKQTNGKAQ